ncbi:MAG: hypothetical protein Q8L78_05845 [Coxiellaceae bacterium]|nr:hypothetical protein [Coxiellaceae bacterium]
MPSESNIQTIENIAFREIKKSIQEIIDNYLKSNLDVLLTITARNCGVTIIGFSDIDEKKYLLAKALLTSLKTSIYTYRELHELLTTAETNNARLVKRTLYSKGALGEALKVCKELIPKNKQNDSRPMRKTVPIYTLFSIKSDSSSLDNNTSIGPDISSNDSPLTVK